MIVRVTWDSSVVVLLGGMLEYESVSKSGTRGDWSRGSFWGFGYIGVLWFCLSLILLMISPNPVYLSDSVSFCSRVRILLTRTYMSSVTFFLLSKVMRSSIPRLICWVDSCILFLWYVKKFISAISKGFISGKPVMVIWFRRFRFYTCPLLCPWGSSICRWNCFGWVVTCHTGIQTWKGFRPSISGFHVSIIWVLMRQSSALLKHCPVSLKHCPVRLWNRYCLKSYDMT
jgi:hypothetical protein